MVQGHRTLLNFSVGSKDHAVGIACIADLRERFLVLVFPAHANLVQICQVLQRKSCLLLSLQKLQGLDRLSAPVSHGTYIDRKSVIPSEQIM